MAEAWMEVYGWSESSVCGCCSICARAGRVRPPIIENERRTSAPLPLSARYAIGLVDCTWLASRLEGRQRHFGFYRNKAGLSLR